MREKSAGAEAAALLKGFTRDANKIKRRAGGKRALRLGAKALLGFTLAFLLLVAIPPFMWPIRGRVTSAFFFRQKPDSAIPLALEFHYGLDIAAPTGSPVHATAPGLVIEAGTAPDLGNYVRIVHLLGVSSVYGHLSRIDAKKGSLILLPALSPLGAVGSTGRSTGPHLHFAIRAGSTPLPPRPLLVFHSIRRAILGF